VKVLSIKYLIIKLNNTMKTRFYLKGVAAFFLLLILAVGCKKEDDPPQFEQIGFDSQEVLDLLPAGLTSSADDKAKECVGMIDDALDMSSFMDNMEVPENAQKTAKKGTTGTWSWTWNYIGGELWTFYWTYDEDNSKMYWTMEIQFGDGPRYDYIEAWEAKDGSGGEVTYNFNWAAIYDGETGYEDLYLRITWNVDTAGNYSYSWYWDADTTEYLYLWRYDIIVNADGSGSIDYYLADELYYHMEWDALGNGTWAYYFGGGLNSTGSWTTG
jgi:hypothetical protein